MHTRDKHRMALAILIPLAIGLVVLLIFISRPDDAACRRLLESYDLHPSVRSETGIGRGEQSGADFLAGLGDITFTEYVTQVRGIEIHPSDQLKGYSYVLEEIGIKSPLHVFILERDGKLLCAALWGAEILHNYEGHPGTYRSRHDFDTYWDIATPLETVRQEMLSQILAG